MTWPFCPQCGTIMDPPETDYIQCTVCSYKQLFQQLNLTEIITKSIVKSKPAWIDDEQYSGSNESSNSENDSNKQIRHAKIEEPCPKCGHHELYFYTMQLRSVDEGQTVFYECPKCQNKHSVNN